VQTPAEEATVIDARVQRRLSDTLTLAKTLGAMVFIYKGEDVARTLLQFAAEYRVGHIVVGKACPKPFWKRLGQKASVGERLIKMAKGITIIVLDTSEALPPSVTPQEEISEEGTLPPAGGPSEPQALSRMLVPGRIVIWNEPVDKHDALRGLAATIGSEAGPGSVERLLEAIDRREAQGSTFLNEGVAFPHVRIEGLAAPFMALGLPRAGVSGVATVKPIEIIFLILTPAGTPDAQVRLLGLASRAAQNRSLIRSLRSVRTPDEALRAIRDWEAPKP
jgi:two-component system, OmpR family, sensor histidine kinase KdpD